MRPGRNGLARLKGDGRVDMGFDPNAETRTRFVEQLEVQADGKILGDY